MLAASSLSLARPLRVAALVGAISLATAGGVTAAEAVPPAFDAAAACAAAPNHGAYVSAVAEATRDQADHGAQVSAAAQSDCGKAAKAARQAAKTSAKAAKAATKAAKRAARAAHTTAKQGGKHAKKPKG